MLRFAQALKPLANQIYCQSIDQTRYLHIMSAPLRQPRADGGNQHGGRKRPNSQNANGRPPKQNNTGYAGASQQKQQQRNMSAAPQQQAHHAPVHHAQREHAAPTKKAIEASFQSGQTFASLNLSAPTMRALNEDFQYSAMSIVQAACIPTALQGTDIVAKAKTGTGKTLAFLIPLVERLLAGRGLNPPRAPQPGTKSVRALVISPTRELAQQIEAEAKELGKHHRIRVACAVGGLNIAKDIRALDNGVLDLLIATPGRLKDLLENYNGIQAQLSHLQYLCLDEADRLLDMGFKPDLDAIFKKLPGPAQRQTVLFSATFPHDVQDMTRRTLKAEHAVVNTVGDEEDQTHQHVVQESIIAPLENHYHVLYELIQNHKAANPNFKIIVFFTTARVASFSSRLFNQAEMDTMELHSRMSQSKRTKTTERFRNGSKLILFSSDVSARGMDFPGVSLIIQVGLTAKDQYIHRLGRTARAGNEGHGIILLAPFENNFLHTLTRELPITPLKLESGGTLATLAEGKMPKYAPGLAKKGYPHPVDYALSLVDMGSAEDEDSLKAEAEAAYRAWLVD